MDPITATTTEVGDAAVTLPQLDVSGIGYIVRTLFANTSTGGLSEGFLSFWSVFSVISLSISALLLYGILYSMIRFGQLLEIENNQLREEEHAYKHLYEQTKEDSKWQGVLDHVSSENPNDWRLAIIEADVMLDQMLTEHGFEGVSIGDKLKGANRDSFKTLNSAWEAHKIRNEVAHGGSDFVLSKRKAQEVVNLYGQVFREFDYI